MANDEGVTFLITSGGTRAPIDEVRYVGNVSSGRFGAEIVRAALKVGCRVLHLRAHHAVHPFRPSIDLSGDVEGQIAELRHRYDEAWQWLPRYEEHEFRTYDDYASLVKQVVTNNNVDVAILAAAVSDYAAELSPGKLSSADEERVLPLTKLPKVIDRLKQWSPKVFLVGFKLAVDVAESELIEQAQNACRRTGANLTVANDYRLLQQGRHTIHVVRPDGSYETFTDNLGDNLVRRVMEIVTEKKGS